MNSELSELLLAVDALTRPVVVAQWQGEVGERTIFKRTDEPLLVQLRLAIHNNIGGSGGGKQARERTPLDVGAFALFEDIDGRVRSWLSDLGGRVGKDLTTEAVLRAWYVLWSAGPHRSLLVERYTDMLEGWAQQIKDKLDPPAQIEITAPCPVCGVEWLNVGLKLPDGSDDPNDVERLRVLAAVERENMDDSFAMCKSCNRVWRGVGQMRALRIAMDDRESASAEGGGVA